MELLRYKIKSYMIFITRLIALIMSTQDKIQCIVPKVYP